jgi:hypothetical protein
VHALAEGNSRGSALSPFFFSAETREYLASQNQSRAEAFAENFVKINPAVFSLLNSEIFLANARAQNCLYNCGKRAVSSIL